MDALRNNPWFQVNGIFIASGVVAIAAGASMLPALAIPAGGAGELAARLVAGGAVFVAALAIARPLRAADAEAAGAIYPWIGRALMRSFARR